MKNQGATDRMVGGRCSYRTYEGTAVIVDIREHASAPDSFEVRFRFQSHEPVQEPFADPTGKIFDLQTPDFRSPNKRYLEEHNLQPGAEVPCVMDVIQSGTCTPVMFRFP
ncbi:MAG: hypothetical protein EOM25_04875 [Deltaproteobacteria bacterium]|nr:hypothetical protein [Deltaproteobacteria bacterium]